MVYRIYVEKKPPYAVQAKALFEELSSILGITALKGVRILNRYDVQGIEEDLFRRCVHTVFSEPPLDDVYDALPQADALFAAEYLPGQFDQRADSAAECIQLINMGERPTVRSARVYLLSGDLSENDLQRIMRYVINPVEAQAASLEMPKGLEISHPVPSDVPILEGFTELKEEELCGFIKQYSLAMDEGDLSFCRDYFKGEGRRPTLTELRMLDTYWSDHCRHTTFSTLLEHVLIEDEQTLKTYNKYLDLRKSLHKSKDKPQTLMDIGTIGAKAIKAAGGLENLDESEEINACSVRISVDNEGKEEDWLLLFKNETHNHPTEIEPFGGAATCIGGAIRDPLAGRGYVFGAMRVTGAANPLAPIKDTLPGKLPQRKICVTAAEGYSSYGNQIGLATSEVTEIYHPGYVAKRMEIGAVLGAVPLENVRRETPIAGDVVLLVGGDTGRDGCGGATGSSKAHGTQSLESCGAEVQKGNPPMERKLQRLFRNAEASRLIVRCNDFGAGGVAVAVGELADGLCIDLDAVPKKYEGLSGTELAISESQERMAVVVNEKDAQRFIQLASAENVKATKVAVVTESPRLVMRWRGKVIADISREFLNSAGAQKKTDVSVPPLPEPVLPLPSGNTLEERFTSMVSELNRCSQKGLGERFDSTIGAGSVLMPFGGRTQLSPADALVMKLPTEGESTTCAGMAFGFDPYISEQNPYSGAYLAVLHSVAKLCAKGFALSDIRLSFQEYFERLHKEPLRWGKPFSALLGALEAQLNLGVGAIGGKDSMSGSFEDMDVPPTLVSFAVAHGSTQNVLPSEFQLPFSRLVWLRPMAAPENENSLVPNAVSFKLLLAQLHKLVKEKKLLSVCAVGAGGLAAALQKMCVGNHVGAQLNDTLTEQQLFAPAFGSFLLEVEEPIASGLEIGETTAAYTLRLGAESVDLAKVQNVWQSVLEPVFPTVASGVDDSPVPEIKHDISPKKPVSPKIGTAKPRVLIPVFPGTNCEYDTARALRRAGAEPEIFVLCNLSPKEVEQSAQALAQKIEQSQMVVLPGGFSGGDEPEGSAKLICAFFRGERVKQAVGNLLHKNDGLMLGICNGFQALIKLGLLPFGEICDANERFPTLTFNTLGRHVSTLSRTKICSNLSPWLSKETLGNVHLVPMSHGEGRFVASEELLKQLAQNGQIATQYVDYAGVPTLALPHNPNGSMMAIEGITSADGRILGKMGHSERSGNSLYINVPGNTHQKLFEGGVDYFNI